MIVILLDKLLELKTKMQGKAHDDLDETAALLCRLTGCGVYLLNWRGVVEGYAPQMQGDECSLVQMLVESGARYGTTDKKWNWYGGLAYEYEFDGKSDGTVNGLPIRAVSIKGSSVRGEIGMKMNATKTNPWQVDVSLYGYGGKHRGIGGNVNVAYMF
ncbi:MAG: autotransporter outer membrane beta-barrel domain-containing protein [Succiniclasticum sp.]|uniref:autotransporter outer membrane beta-barrel domain-containing protein n=1 Tax=Succiniclasticum sp. TaxID=2775030 RepID=UPI002A912138|nr:autotransporter outer membrane beta-barrel domain-containing protein [Succiniclasticum sp.]MDY6292292.1 autotransporter outer membrane beta-barrel domain-containing protein [Succiniclasticum sp.]